MCFLRTLKNDRKEEEGPLGTHLISTRTKDSHLHSMKFPDKFQVKSTMIPLEILFKPEFGNYSF